MQDAKQYYGAFFASIRKTLKLYNIDKLRLQELYLSYIIHLLKARETVAVGIYFPPRSIFEWNRDFKL